MAPTATGTVIIDAYCPGSGDHGQTCDVHHQQDAHQQRQFNEIRELRLCLTHIQFLLLPLLSTEDAAHFLAFRQRLLYYGLFIFSRHIFPRFVNGKAACSACGSYSILFFFPNRDHSLQK